MLVERNHSDIHPFFRGPLAYSKPERTKSYSSIATASITTRTMTTSVQRSGRRSSTGSNFGSIDWESSPVILVGSNDHYSSASTFTVSESDFSSQWAESTDCSSIYSYSDPTGSPPKVIKVSKTCHDQFQPTSLPYAQLCFDPERKTMVTMMEIDFSGPRKQSNRLTELDAILPTGLGPVDFPLLRCDPSSATCAESTISTHLESIRGTKINEPMILLGTQGMWLEESELDRYLLHDAEDPWQAESKRGCTESLRKLLQAYRARLVSRQRANSWEQPREPFLGIGYKVLDNNEI